MKPLESLFESNLSKEVYVNNYELLEKFCKTTLNKIVPNKKQVCP